MHIVCDKGHRMRVDLAECFFLCDTCQVRVPFTALGAGSPADFLRRGTWLPTQHPLVQQDEELRKLGKASKGV